MRVRPNSSKPHVSLAQVRVQVQFSGEVKTARVPGRAAVSGAVLAASLVLLAGGCRGGKGPAAGAFFKVEGVASWRGDAAAAYSLIHDDVCSDGVEGVFSHADPELARRGLHAGFGVIAGVCESKKRWNKVRQLVAHGHEVFSHSWSHPCMTNDHKLAESCNPTARRSIDFLQEIDVAGAVMLQRLGAPPDFFIFPFDVCDPAAIARLQKQGYLGARCGESGINPAAAGDDFAIRFDVFGPAYSIYFDAPACKGVKQYETPPEQTSAACRAHVLDHYVEDAITQRGWAVRELHGFDDDGGSFEPVPVTEYAAHLDHVLVKVRAGQLWVEGPTRVLKYRSARASCPLPVATERGTFTFATPSAACRRSATLLTYLVSTTDGTDPAALTSEQAGSRTPARKLARGRFAVDADPTRGPVVLRPEGT